MHGPEPGPPALPGAAEAAARRFYVQTFGCRCNQADSAGIRAQLAGLELRESDRPEAAAFIVLNGCTVTAHADHEVRRALRKLGRDHPTARLVGTGCYAERDPEALARIPGVALVVGSADRERLAAPSPSARG
jgi:threonylcarbamoyladenosine tRNA methylthiotransferase MtaB